MKRSLLFLAGLHKLILFFLLISQNAVSQELHFRKIEIDTNYSFRGLSVVDDSVAWVSGVNGVVGRTSNGGQKLGIYHG